MKDLKPEMIERIKNCEMKQQDGYLIMMITLPTPQNDGTYMQAMDISPAAFSVALYRCLLDDYAMFAAARMAVAEAQKHFDNAEL